MANTFDKKRIGSIWAKKSKAGNDYFSGLIEVDGKEVNFIAFSNKTPNGPSSPAHFIYESDPLPPKESKGAPTTVTGKTKPAKAKPAAPAAEPAAPSEADETPL
jgi:hypothetical protein